MDRGSYVASSGGLIQSRRLEVIGNNLANINTVGFKAQRVVSHQQDFSDTLASIIPGTPSRAKSDHEQTPGAVDLRTVTDFSLGPVTETGNPIHAALMRPNDFFVVQTEQGPAYTRAGNFTLNGEGALVTPDGLPVLGDGGPIVVQNGTPSITKNGTVLVDGQEAGSLSVVEIEDTSLLKRLEGSRFILEGGQPATVEEVQLVPGAVEMPNVNIVESIVEMISVGRTFEAYTKTLKSIDELNERAMRMAQR